MGVNAGDTDEFRDDWSVQQNMTPQVRTKTTSELIVAASMVVVNHGTDQNFPRPVGAAAVYWTGSVEPTNALNSDLWPAP